ncbi:MAG: bacillithiol system redox-active protein YtxJ [Bacteroidota bacterium]
MWLDLTDRQQLDELTIASHGSTQVIFKHSTRCSISRVALSRFDRQPTSAGVTSFYLLDLLQHRPLSQAITEQFGIPHESPQVLVIRDGACQYHANHLDIEPEEVYAHAGITGSESL